MKFVQRDLGAAAEASSGGGRSGWRREVLLLGTALLALTLGLWFGIGWAVELSLPLISVETEQRWFGSFEPARTTPTTGLASPGDARFTRAEAVLARLRADPVVPGFNYRLFVLPDTEPNAFAFPGGSLGVTRGLLDLAGDDEAAIAFVLGHELGHFAHRDQLRGIGRQLGRSLAWSLIFGEDGSGLLESHVANLLDLRHSRGQEHAADLYGLELVHRVYGTTKGTDRLFVWLEQRERSPAWMEMLQTHPQPEGRLQGLRAHAARLQTGSAP
jgi:Zn-dependent protease with chaperone function